MTKLSPNEVVQFISAQNDSRFLFRIVHIDVQRDAALLLLITEDEKLTAPQVRSYSGLLQSLDRGEARVTRFMPPQWMLLTEDSLGEFKSGSKYKTIRDRNLELIKPLISNPSFIQDPFASGRLVLETAVAAGVHKKHVYRLLYRYWKYGMIPNAFLPAFMKCGDKGQIREPKEAKRGRRNRCLTTEHANKPGINISEDYRKLIHLGIAAFFKTKKQHTLAWAYKRTLETFFNEGYEDQDGVLIPRLRPAAEVPTYGQFRYWHLRQQNEIETIRARLSERKWLLSKRPIKGCVRDGVWGPGVRFEIDSTIADVYLVSRYNRRWIIGRPVVYLVVDVFSRMIVGFHVALSGPSIEGASMACVNAFCDKVEFCALYGVGIEPGDWPCHHLPLKLTADRGELVGHGTEGMIKGLGLNIDHAPPYRPDWKPVVERDFRVLNDATIHWIPGAVRARQKERGERDYRLDATLTMEEFIAILIHSILRHNLYTERPDLLTEEMMACNVRPYCVDIWLWGLEHLTGTLRTYDRETVFAHLLPSGRATITPAGVQFHDMLYTSERADLESWGALARINGPSAVEIRYDPNSTNRIWIMAEGANAFETFTLKNAESQDRYRDRRLEEVLDMLEYLKLEGIDRIDEKRQGICEHDNFISSIVKKAEKAKKAAGASKESVRATIGNIKRNRRFENLGAAGAVPLIVVPDSSDSQPGNTAENTILKARHENFLQLIKEETAKEEY